MREGWEGTEGNSATLEESNHDLLGRHSWIDRGDLEFFEDTIPDSKYLDCIGVFFRKVRKNLLTKAFNALRPAVTKIPSIGS